MPTHPNILIITLYCGENEYEACKKSVADQDYAGTVDHVFIENLPNIKAHKTCYQMIMDRSDHYDLFMKLDADMAFTRPCALTDIVEFWTQKNKPDHITFAVHDFIPDRLSMGVHLFTKNCRWNLETHDGLFVDPNPQHNGDHIKIWDDPAPFVSHAFDPSDFGAYHFGVHRALKAFQWDRFFAAPQGLEAFRILTDTAKHYERTKDPRLKLALMGAESIRKKKLTLQSGDKIDTTIIEMDIDFWMQPIKAKIYWFIFVGLRLLPMALWRKIKTAMS